MRRRILGQNVLSSAFLILFGTTMFWLGRDLPLGTAMVMGPGYIPFALAGIVTAIGLVLAIFAWSDPGPSIGTVHLRPLALISIAVLSLALLLERAGLMVASASTVLLSALAAPATPLRESVVLALALALFVCALFVWLLGVPVAAWVLP